MVSCAGWAKDDATDLQKRAAETRKDLKVEKPTPSPKPGTTSDKDTVNTLDEDDPRSPIIEVVATKSFVEFSELDALPSDIVRWGTNSGKYLYISRNESPF